MFALKNITVAAIALLCLSEGVAAKGVGRWILRNVVGVRIRSAEAMTVSQQCSVQLHDNVALKLIHDDALNQLVVHGLPQECVNVAKADPEAFGSPAKVIGPNTLVVENANKDVVKNVVDSLGEFVTFE